VTLRASTTRVRPTCEFAPEVVLEGRLTAKVYVARVASLPDVRPAFFDRQTVPIGRLKALKLDMPSNVPL
jgi:hypothetical protein